jgi:hypothetical protein
MHAVGLMLLAIGGTFATTASPSPAAGAPRCVDYDGQVFNRIRDHGISDQGVPLKVYPLRAVGVPVRGGWLVAATVFAKHNYGWGVWLITKRLADPGATALHPNAGGRIYSVNAVARVHTTLPRWPKAVAKANIAAALACARS